MKEKNAYFAGQLIGRLAANQIKPTPSVLASAFNKYVKTTVAKPHTVRKWLLVETQPKGETLVSLADWLKVDLKDLLAKRSEAFHSTKKVSFKFNFADQEVISKYLAMTLKQKFTVRLLIDAIADQAR